MTPLELAKGLISIHAPTRGATAAGQIKSCNFNVFQSTLPHGERRGPCNFPTSVHCISIHAPTRGATREFFYLNYVLLHFNPRSHSGSDVECNYSLPLLNDFNPRSHTGSDSQRNYETHQVSHFNPRSHTGSDCKNRQNRTDRIRVFTQTFIQTSISYLLIMQ